MENQVNGTGSANGTEVVSDVKNTNKKKRRRNGKLSVKQKVFISILLVLYAIVLAATSFLVFYRPRVENTTIVYIETIYDSDGNIIEIPIEYEREEGEYNILVLGHDRSAMLTDVFMLVNLNCDTGGITVMQIPRDTYIGNTDEEYVMTNKINAVFATHFNRNRGNGMEAEDAYDAALDDLTKDLEESLCIQIDYSAIMNLNGFVNIVDILGGVEIDIPYNMNYYDPAQNLYINIPAGHHVLNGTQSEGFVRYRSGYATADLGRQNAQKQFMTALFASVKNNISISNVGDLTGEIFANIDTDMSAADVLFFAKEILQSNLSDINMMTMPGNLANSYYVMNRAAVLQVINTSFNVLDKPITDGIFDASRRFNNAGIYSMNEAYYLPADKMWDNTVYNGEDVNEEGIYINRN